MVSKIRCSGKASNFGFEAAIAPSSAFRAILRFERVEASDTGGGARALVSHRIPGNSLGDWEDWPPSTASKKLRPRLPRPESSKPV